MLFKVRALSAFESSFSEIVQYLDEISSEVSLRFICDLERQIINLENRPFLYPAYEYDERFRKMPMYGWKYIVFYVPDEKTGEVVLYDVLHASRDILVRLKNKF